MNDVKTEVTVFSQVSPGTVHDWKMRNGHICPSMT